MEKKSKKVEAKNILFFIVGAILIGLIVFLLIRINSKKIDEKWKTDTITISLVDGTSFDITNKETVARISRLCNDGLFREVPNDSKVDGSCEIWIDFNNGTIIGMFQNRDYGYVGEIKEYIGESMYLPSGLNEFIKNVISLNIKYIEIQGEIIESRNLGYLLLLDEDSQKIIDTENVFVSYENLPFTDIKDLNFENGDIIKVYYNGNIIEAYPPQIYCARLEYIGNIDDGKEVEPVIKQEEIDEGYEVKDIASYVEKEEDTGVKFKKINLNELSITDSIPDWVIGETGFNGLYSINVSDYLADVTAFENYSSYMSDSWTEEQMAAIGLGQGMKCFNSDNVLYYYPYMLNGNIVGLLEVQEMSGSYGVRFTTEFVNALNDILKYTSSDSPLILLKVDGFLCGMIEDTIYSESTIDYKNIDLSEISGESIVNVMEELTITEIEEVGESLDNGPLE